MSGLNESGILALIRAAAQARLKAYCPYSHFQVGAALLTEEDVLYLGCNVENSSYGGTICAERTAFCKAISEGERKFKAIAIMGGLEGKEVEGYAYPCGSCRQVMSEFCGEDFIVIVAKNEKEYLVSTLGEMLPFSFHGSDIR